MTGKKLKVLIVEDHADTAAVCCRLLRTYGHAASSVNSVEELVAKATTATFDVLVCDIGLAGMSGLSIPKLFPSIPAVAMTGYGAALDVKACLDAGFCEHLLKPIAIEALVAAIDRCTDFKPCAVASPWAISR